MDDKSFDFELRVNGETYDVYMTLKDAQQAAEYQAAGDTVEVWKVVKTGVVTSQVEWNKA